MDLGPRTGSAPQALWVTKLVDRGGGVGLGQHFGKIDMLMWITGRRGGEPSGEASQETGVAWEGDMSLLVPISVGPRFPGKGAYFTSPGGTRVTIHSEWVKPTLQRRAVSGFLTDGRHLRLTRSLLYVSVSVSVSWNSFQSCNHCPCYTLRAQESHHLRLQAQHPQFLSKFPVPKSLPSALA